MTNIDNIKDKSWLEEYTQKLSQELNKLKDRVEKDNLNRAKQPVQEYKNKFINWLNTWNINIKTPQSIGELFSKIWDFGQEWFELNSQKIKKDKEWEYLEYNWTKIRIVSNETKLNKDGFYYLNESVYFIAKDWKTRVNISTRSWVWDEWWYHIEFSDDWWKTVYTEDQWHDDLFKLREYKYISKRINQDKSIWEYSCSRLFKFEWEFENYPKNSDFKWTWIFHFKDWTILKWTFSISEDWDYLDIVIEWEWELIRKDWKKELIHKRNNKYSKPELIEFNNYSIWTYKE